MRKRRTMVIPKSLQKEANELCKQLHPHLIDTFSVVYGYKKDESVSEYCIASWDVDEDLLKDIEKELFDKKKKEKKIKDEDMGIAKGKTLKIKYKDKDGKEKEKEIKPINKIRPDIGPQPKPKEVKNNGNK